ncbi:hypothetical protein TKK_0008329 [Trichogramma kaykai]
MSDSVFSIIDFDPEDFKIVLNGKKFAWQGVALLPFVEEQRLFKALEPYYDLLTEADKKRTVRGVYTPEGSTTLNRHSRKIETSNCINKHESSNVMYSFSRTLYTSSPFSQVIRRTRLRVVDNSEIGKKAMAEGKTPYVFHVYYKMGVGYIGDRVVHFDVLIEDTGSPIETRIHVPIPHVLSTLMKEKTHWKGADYTKLIAIASRFI